MREELLKAVLHQQGALSDHKGLTATVQQLTGRQASIAAQVQVIAVQLDS